jgi:hypothetical protein
MMINALLVTEIFFWSVGLILRRGLRHEKADRAIDHEDRSAVYRVAAVSDIHYTGCKF